MLSGLQPRITITHKYYYVLGVTTHKTLPVHNFLSPFFSASEFKVPTYKETISLGHSPTG